MKIRKNYKLLSLAVIVFLLSLVCVYAYPPDNAAVLYFKALMRYSPDNEMSNLIENFVKEDTKLNVEKIRDFVNKNRYTINTALDATEIKNCDWGLNLADGLEMDVPHIRGMRQLTYLVLAESKILAIDQDYVTAIDRCMSVYKMARHTNDSILVSYLVGIAINGAANSCIMQIMEDMPQDKQMMTMLKNKFADIHSEPLSVMPAVLGERQGMLTFMTKENIPAIIDMAVDDQAMANKLLTFDETMMELSRKYFDNLYSGFINAFNMPYQQGYTTINELAEKAFNDAKDKPEAMLTTCAMPAMGRVFSLATRINTHDNAIRTAIEVYLMKAKTGKLPDSLPEGLPGDLFSGMDFEYEKTADGFVLRCQGKEFGSEETHQYEFKVQ